MSDLAVHVHLDMPSRADRRFGAVLESAAAKTGAEPQPRVTEPGIYWGPDQFELTGVRAFTEASEETQQQILVRGGQMLLEEAYFIEKSGMAFTAKMSLLSRTTEERMLYSLFAADEASHLYEVRGFLPDDPKGTSGPFLALLASLIEQGDRDSLVFVIQVVLEGWGLTHYRSMAESCQAPKLKAVLGRILKDEARHHGSGMLMFDEDALSKQSRAYIVETLVQFMGMVRTGPQGIVHIIEQATGGLTSNQRLELFTQLQAEDHSRSRLNILKGLMIRAGASRTVELLANTGALAPMTVQECCRC